LSKTKSADGWSGVIKGRPNLGDSAERVEINEVWPDKPVCKLDTVRNQASDICLNSTATVYTVQPRRS
jgi:hypothetical protein